MTLRKLRQKIWYALYPIWPQIEHFFLFIHGNRRQPYKLGWLVEGETLATLKTHLASKWGFGNHFVAWEDKGQVLSWRKLDGFENQYHLRVFRDGEIRGHYEYTPESTALMHLMRARYEARTKEFIKFLGPFLSHKKTQHRLRPDFISRRREPEVTFQK